MLSFTLRFLEEPKHSQWVTTTHVDGGYIEGVAFDTIDETLEYVRKFTDEYNKPPKPLPIEEWIRQELQAKYLEHLNSFGESQTDDGFEKNEYRFLIEHPNTISTQPEIPLPEPGVPILYLLEPETRSISEWFRDVILRRR